MTENRSIVSDYFCEDPKQTLPDFPTTCAQSYPPPRTRPAILTNGRGASRPPSKQPCTTQSTTQTPRTAPAKPASGTSAKTPRNLPAPAPPPAKPFPPGTGSPTVSLPKPTSMTASALPVPPKKCSCAASPPINGVWIAPCQSKPVSSVSASKSCARQVAQRRARAKLLSNPQPPPQKITKRTQPVGQAPRLAPCLRRGRRTKLAEERAYEARAGRVPAP